MNQEPRIEINLVFGERPRYNYFLAVYLEFSILTQLRKPPACVCKDSLYNSASDTLAQDSSGFQSRWGDVTEESFKDI